MCVSKVIYNQPDLQSFVMVEGLHPDGVTSSCLGTHVKTDQAGIPPHSDPDPPFFISSHWAIKPDYCQVPARLASSVGNTNTFFFMELSTKTLSQGAITLQLLLSLNSSTTLIQFFSWNAWHNSTHLVSSTKQLKETFYLQQPCNVHIMINSRYMSVVEGTFYDLLNPSYTT